MVPECQKLRCVRCLKIRVNKLQVVGWWNQPFPGWFGTVDVGGEWLVCSKLVSQCLKFLRFKICNQNFAHHRHVHTNRFGWLYVGPFLWNISGSHMFHPVTLELDHVFHAVRAFVLNWKSPTACNTRHVRGGLWSTVWNYVDLIQRVW